MARDFARILTSVWRDPDWRALPHTSQWLYLQLISRPDVNAAGVLSVNVSRWARGSEDLTEDDVRTAFKTLVQRRYVVVDSHEDEMLIRSFIRNDGIVKQPKVMIGACRQAMNAESPEVRRALAAELERVRPDVSDMARKEVERALEELTEDDPEPPGDAASKPDESGIHGSYGNPIHDTADTLSAKTNGEAGKPNRLGSGVVTGVVTSCPVGGSVSSSSETASLDLDVEPVPAAEAPAKDEPGAHPRADALCERLADRVAENDVPRPEVIKAWRKEARLLLDRDGRDFDEACRLIDWAQSDSFWRSNVLGMPKFRKQYDQLVLRARETPRWRIAAPHGARDALTDAEVKAILQPPHRDYPEPPDEIAGDPAARSGWFEQKRAERLAHYRVQAEQLLEQSPEARNILARLRRTS